MISLFFLRGWTRLVDYLVGRQAGYYLPSFPPTYETKTADNNLDYQKIMKEETLRDMIRKNLRT